jgi:hypothetical protein
LARNGVRLPRNVFHRQVTLDITSGKMTSQ